MRLRIQYGLRVGERVRLLPVVVQELECKDLEHARRILTVEALKEPGQKKFVHSVTKAPPVPRRKKTMTASSEAELEQLVQQVSETIRQNLLRYMGEVPPADRTVRNIRSRVEQSALEVAEAFKLTEFIYERDVEVKVEVDKDDPTVVHLDVTPKTKIGEVFVCAWKWGTLQPPPMFIELTLSPAPLFCDPEHHTFGNDGVCTKCGGHR